MRPAKYNEDWRGIPLGVGRREAGIALAVALCVTAALLLVVALS